ncbi:cytosine permease [Sporolactobacillus sp. THM7-4]|nr:cytosine permease [Sporolactobacillus sp. THM7-4]
MSVADENLSGQDLSPAHGQEIEYGATTPVPPKARSLSFWDMLATWTCANANNGTWFIGGVVAATTFTGSLLVTLIANPIAYLVMALVGYAGYKVGTSTMALTRPSFGVRGSYLPSILNMTQLIGWTAVNTFIAAISISFLLKDAFGFAAFGEPGSYKAMLIGIIIMTILHFISISLGHRSVKVIERIGIVLVIILGLWETVIVLQNVSFSQILAWRPPAHLRMPFGSAMDTMAAFSLAWVTVIAEFTRYGKNRSTSTVAPMIGANIGLFWFAFVGIIATIGAAVATGTYDPNNSDPSSIASRLGLGWLAMVIIILTSTTANAINLMGAGISLTNTTKKMSPILSLWTVTLAAAIVTFIPLLVGSFLESFIGFLDYIGMVFGPLLGIVITDFYLVHKRSYDASEMEKANGKYWFSGGFNVMAFAAWIIGVILFLLTHKLPLFSNTIGATYPVIILSGLIYYLFMTQTKKRKVS